MENQINIRNEHQLAARLPMASELVGIAKEHGLKAFFINYTENDLGIGNTSARDGMYLVICPNESREKEFYNMIYFEKDRIRELIDNIDEERGILNTQYCMIPLKYITPENDFMIYQRCVRSIHDLAAVHSAYGEQGLNPPDYITRETINVLQKFIKKRYANNIPKELRDAQAEAMKKFVLGSAERYKYDKPIRHRILRPHEVRRDYFFNNHIAVVNDAVTDDFWKYIKTRWNEVSEFVIYRESKPFVNLKDGSKTPTKLVSMFPQLEKYWADFTKQKKYRVAYPAGYQELFNSWRFDYLAKKLEWDKQGFIVPIEYLDRNYQLKLLEVDSVDIFNVCSLAVANNVKMAINHGELGKVNGTNTYSFIYSDKDTEMVRAIKSRLTRETSGISKDSIVPGELWHLSKEKLAEVEAKDRIYRENLAKKESKRQARKEKLQNIFGSKEKETEPVKQEVVRGRGYQSGYDDINF